MHIGKISLYLITFNEENRLARTLEAVRDLVDEIIIVDSGSTDKTREIAESFGAKFIFHEWESDGPQCKFAEEQCSNRWVLRLDADEVMTPELKDEIREIMKNGDKNAYFLRIGEIFPGMTKANPWVKHFKLKRLYNRDYWTMSGLMSHDDLIKVRPDATAGTCRHFINHYSFVSIHQTVKKYDASSTVLVNRLIAQGKRYSGWKLLGCSTLEFLKYYILGRFFLLGWWGFIHCANIGWLKFMKVAKLYEHYSNPDPERENYISPV